MSALLELAERCEAATGPDYQLEREIAIAVNRPQRVSQYEGEHWRHYTSSVDAALMLVPEGMERGVVDCVGGSLAQVWKRRPGFEGKGKTWPLAICAAALRAKASEQNNG